MKTAKRPTLTYAVPEVINAGFALGQPVLDARLDGAPAGCLFRSYLNADRRLVETFQFHRKGGQPEGPKFDVLEDLILWLQETLLEEAK